MKRNALEAVLVLSAVIGLGFGSQIRAESDYEFAGRLLDVEKDSSAFPTQDLVEHLIGQLDRSSKKESKLEGRMIRARLLRNQVASASLERKKELLDEADRIYKEFLRDGVGHPLLDEGKKAADEIQLEFAKALIDTAKADPTGGAEPRRRAVDVLEGIKQRQKAEVERVSPVLVEASKEYMKALAEGRDGQVPAKVMEKVGSAIETVVSADQQYLQTWLMQVDAYADTDQTKSKEVEELGKYCQARVDGDQLSEFGLACAFYLYSKGRAYSYVLNEKGASDAWKEALDQLPVSVEGSATQTVRALQRMIIFDLVQMKMKVGDKDPAKYEDVISLVKQIKMNSEMSWILNEPSGKQMQMDCAIAMVRQPESSAVEVADAIKVLREVGASGPPWSYIASQTMAKVLSEAGQKKRPRLNAQEWFDTARGFFYQGQQAYKRFEELKQGGDAAKAAKEYTEATGHYEQAIEYYRRVIAIARNAEVTAAVTRLSIEPTAWFEMGISYQKMDQLLEAAVAYRALRDTFDKKARERWLPSKYESRQQEAQAKKLLEDLDREEGKDEGLLKRSGRNMIIAINKLPPTPPNKRLKEKMLDEGGADLDNLGGGDIDYDKAKLALVDAQGFEEQARMQTRERQPEEVATNLLQAYKRYKDGVKGFSEVKTSSRLYEVALYQAGSSAVQAQVLLVDKISRTEKMKDDDVAAQAKELAIQGAKAFQQYEEYVTKTHNPAPEVEARREKLIRLIKLSRTTLFYNAGMTDECIKACDEYLKTYAADLKDLPDDPRLLTVVFNKFRSLSNLGGDKNPPECGGPLEEAGKLLPHLKAKESYYRYAIGNLTARYFNASVRAEKAQMDAETVRTYDDKLADYLTQGLRLKPEAERDLDDYGRLLGVLEKVKNFVAASDIAEEMLKLFDPEGKNCRRSDDDWPAILKRMQDVIRFTDLKRMEDCRKDHAVLVDYLYEEDRNIDMEEKLRPSHDKFPVDFGKVQLQIDTIKRNYPKCGTLDPKEGVEGKCWLDIIKEEVDYRQRIVATRQLLADSAIAAADEMEKRDADKAAQYRKVADQQLSILLDMIGNVPSMKLKQCELRVANKDYEGALKILYDVKHGESRNNSSELYVKTSIQISKIYQLMGDGKSAAEYPHFLVTTAGPKSRAVERYWPDIEEFLQWCYANGASPLKEVKVDTVVDYTPKTPDEIEFIEVVEPSYREASKNGVENIQPGVRWRYEFLKAKIENWSEFCDLDRVLQFYRGKPNEKEVLTDDFMTRYQTLEALHTMKTKLRRLAQELDEAIVNFGSFDAVKEKKPELLEHRNKVTAEIAELTRKLKSLPALTIPKLEGAAGSPKGGGPGFNKEEEKSEAPKAPKVEEKAPTAKP